MHYIYTVLYVILTHLYIHYTYTVYIQATHDKDWRSWRACLLDLTQSISSRTRAAFYLRTDGTLRSLDVIMTALQLREDTPLMRHELGYILGGS